LTTTVVECTPADEPIVSITSLPVGTYDIEVEGLQNGVILYSGSDSIAVPASGATKSMNLALVANPVTVTFIFGAPSRFSDASDAMSCAEAGVQSVTLSVDGATPIVKSCHDSTSGLDAASVYATPGTHTVAGLAYTSRDGTGTALYSVTTSGVAISATGINALTANFAGLINGGFALTWQFDVSASNPPILMGTCANANVTMVVYSATDAAGTILPNLPMMPVSCSDPTEGFSIATTPGLLPGVYFVTSVDGESNGATTYSAANLRVYVPAGQEPAFTIVLSPTM
jgi:hypothetical protein